MASIAEKSNTGVTEEEHGGEEARQGGNKNRGKSKDVLASLDASLVEVKTSMGGLGARLEKMASDNAKIGDLRREIQGLRGMLMGELVALRAQVEGELTTFRQRVEDVQTDVGMCKRVVANGRGTVTATQGIEIPKPSTFAGQRDARALDDFIWEVEQDFDGMSVEDDATKIKIATRYLKDTTALWWRLRKEDIEKGTCTMETWADFIREIKRVFYPKNAEDEERSQLRKLKHTRSIRAYVKEFTTLTLEIPDLSDKDSHFYYIDGLQP